MNHANVGTESVRWKWGLLVLCGLSLLLTFAYAADTFGLAGRPWFGWWDANAALAGRPYVLSLVGPRADGASARAGMRNGDRMDLREQSLDGRTALVFQPLATRPTHVTVHRGAATFVASPTGSTTFEGPVLWKLPPPIARSIANLWLVICAAIIAVRRWWTREARMLALVLLFITASVFDPSSFVVPSGALNVLLLVVSRALVLTAALLLVRLSSEFGVRSALRTIVERVAYASIAVCFCADLAAALGLMTLWIDPLPFIFRISPMRHALEITATLLVAIVAGLAIANTASSDRPRTAWLLLPIPIVGLLTGGADAAAMLISSWFANVAVVGFAAGLRLFGALIVTYALLKRRVLDLEFVVSRTLVVATISLIVVAAFVLLEWILGTVLSGASHATGLIANGALALVLGLSLSVIQKRVEAGVDRVLFRERHENERALLDFSKEAAFVTRADALLDQAVEKIERHTDARNASIMLDGDHAYAAARSFGAHGATRIDENDGAILALKTWHKPIEPQRYASALRGALAVPMLARGRLLGVLALGERAGGEAYAPGEIDALAEFAHGVGSALDGLDLATGNGAHVAIAESSIAALAAAVAAQVRETLNAGPDAEGLSG